MDLAGGQSARHAHSDKLSACALSIAGIQEWLECIGRYSNMESELTVDALHLRVSRTTARWHLRWHASFENNRYSDVKCPKTTPINVIWHMYITLHAGDPV